MKYLLLGLLFMILYRFVVRFVLPLIQVTRVAQNKMREMQAQMEQMQQQQHKRDTHRNRPIEGDYIDYEEVK